jgi:hypothetical protein
LRTVILHLRIVALKRPIFKQKKVREPYFRPILLLYGRISTPILWHCPFNVCTELNSSLRICRVNRNTCLKRGYDVFNQSANWDASTVGLVKFKIFRIFSMQDLKFWLSIECSVGRFATTSVMNERLYIRVSRFWTVTRNQAQICSFSCKRTKIFFIFICRSTGLCRAGHDFRGNSPYRGPKNLFTLWSFWGI